MDLWFIVVNNPSWFDMHNAIKLSWSPWVFFFFLAHEVKLAWFSCLTSRQNAAILIFRRNTLVVIFVDFYILWPDGAFYFLTRTTSPASLSKAVAVHNWCQIECNWCLLLVRIFHEIHTYYLNKIYLLNSILNIHVFLLKNNIIRGLLFVPEAFILYQVKCRLCLFRRHPIPDIFRDCVFDLPEIWK